MISIDSVDIPGGRGGDTRTESAALRMGFAVPALLAEERPLEGLSQVHVPVYAGRDPSGGMGTHGS